MTSLIVDNKLKQEQQQQQSKEKVFYVLRKKTMHGRYDVISLYDGNGSFRGPAIFDNEQDALKYKDIYEQKLIRKYLYENEKRRMLKRGAGGKYQMMKSAADIKVCLEKSLPQF